MNAEQYWFRLNAAEKGPYSREQVFLLLAKGKIQWTTPCRHGDRGEWKALSSQSSITPAAGSTTAAASQAMAAEAAAQAIPCETNQQQLEPPTDVPDTPRSSSRGRRGRRLMIMIACLLAAACGFFLLKQIDFHSVIAGDGHGLGDTILKYRDRNYENAKWTKLKETASLATLIAAGDSSSTVKLERVTGWDRDNLWVVSEYGHVFQLHQGHWRYRGRPAGSQSPVVRAFDRQTLLILGSSDSPGLFQRVDDRGISEFGKIGHYTNGHPEITFTNRDVFEIHDERAGIIRFADGQREERREDRFPEALLFRSDNTPLKDYPLRRLRFARHYSDGKAYAICPPNIDGLEMKYKIVRSADGRWYEAGDFTSDYLTLKAVWFGGTVAQPFLVAAGTGGWVWNQAVPGTGIGQAVQAANELTSRTLIGVWGVSPEKYWVVDSNGTVWERNGSESRVVVRGFYREGITFRDVWIAPDGAVFAITDQHLVCGGGIVQRGAGGK